MLIAFRLIDERIEEHRHMVHQFFDGTAYEEAQIHQHLVVATATAVNLLAHIAQAAGEQQFHLAMHIFHAVLDGKLASLYLGIDISQFCHKCGEFAARKQPYRFEHSDVCQRAQHIISSQIHIHLAVATHGVGLYIVVYFYVLFPKFRCHIINFSFISLFYCHKGKKKPENYITSARRK